MSSPDDQQRAQALAWLEVAAGLPIRSSISEIASKAGRAVQEMKIASISGRANRAAAPMIVERLARSMIRSSSMPKHSNREMSKPAFSKCSAMGRLVSTR